MHHGQYSTRRLNLLTNALWQGLQIQPHDIPTHRLYQTTVTVTDWEVSSVCFNCVGVHATWQVMRNLCLLLFTYVLCLPTYWKVFQNKFTSTEHRVLERSYESVVWGGRSAARNYKAECMHWSARANTKLKRIEVIIMTAMLIWSGCDCLFGFFFLTRFIFFRFLCLFYFLREAQLVR